MSCKGVEILFIFVIVSGAQSLASVAQFDFCEINVRIQTFLSRMTRINTRQTNCADYPNDAFAKLKRQPFMCLAGGDLNDTAMEACFGNIVGGLRQFRDVFFAKSCSEPSDTLKYIHQIFLSSGLFPPNEVQAPATQAAEAESSSCQNLEGGLLNCSAFYLRLYLANVHRHMSDHTERCQSLHAGGTSNEKLLEATKKPRQTRNNNKGARKHRRKNKGRRKDSRKMGRKSKKARQRGIESITQAMVIPLSEKGVAGPVSGCVSSAV